MQQWLFYLSICILSSTTISLSAQCDNDTHYPVALLEAPSIEGEVVVISETQYAGDYCKMSNFVSGITYLVSSSILTDYITIRASDTNEVIAHGSAPLTYVPDVDGTVTIHVNLSDPPCGEQSANRTTTVAHQGEYVNIGKIGVRTNTPLAALDVNGKIKISDDIHAPHAGMMRYNSGLNDFEGYDGVKWRSLTRPMSEWGELLAPKVVEQYRINRADSIQSRLGQSIALDGVTAVINTTLPLYGSEGRALIYDNIRDQNTAAIELYEPTASEASFFATGEVDIKDDKVIVGTLAVTDILEPINGSATIYHHIDDEWIMQCVMVPDTIEEDFGKEVSIDASYAVVSGQVNRGVYVYEFDGNEWSVLQEIVDHYNISGGFGYEIKTSANKVYISAPTRAYDNTVGVVYVYALDEDNLFELQDSIVCPNDGDDTHSFGYTFDVDGDDLVIGAPIQSYQDYSQSGYAAIYHHDGDTWVQKAILTTPLEEVNAQFGNRVSLDSDKIVIGTNNSQELIQQKSMAFVYEIVEGEWALSTKLRPSNLNSSTYFGEGVAISDSTIIVSDPNQCVAADKQGMIYIYHK